MSVTYKIHPVQIDLALLTRSCMKFHEVTTCQILKILLVQCEVALSDLPAIETAKWGSKTSQIQK
jgi:hypothetical protein